jgi:hypothetical protein
MFKLPPLGINNNLRPLASPQKRDFPREKKRERERQRQRERAGERERERKEREKEMKCAKF